MGDSFAHGLPVLPPLMCAFRASVFCGIGNISHPVTHACPVSPTEIAHSIVSVWIMIVSLFPKFRWLSNKCIVCVYLCHLNIRLWCFSLVIFVIHVCSIDDASLVILLIFVLLFPVLCCLCWWLLHSLCKCSCVHS